MDEIVRLLSKQFALAQKMCELKNQLGHVMEEYEKIGIEIERLRMENGNDK